MRRLQARHGLNVDGVVGPSTWGLIGVHTLPTLTPPASALPQEPTRHPHHESSADTAAETGSAEAPTGDPISRLQAALHLSTDGEFGPETEAAVRRLQARHGLHVDGVVGPATWALIGVSDEHTLTPPRSAMVEPSEGSSSSSGGPESTAGGGEGVVSRVIAAGDEIATRPYVWGGGHGSFESDRVRLLGLGLLRAPRRRPAELAGGLDRARVLRCPRPRQVHHDLRQLRTRLDGRRRQTLRHRRPRGKRLAVVEQHGLHRRVRRPPPRRRVDAESRPKRRLASPAPKSNDDGSGRCSRGRMRSRSTGSRPTM